MKIIDKLNELNLQLPPTPLPAASYVTAVEINGLLFISGQGPLIGPDPVFTGRVGIELTEAQGYAAAQLTALNLLAVIESQIGLDSVKSFVKLTGWVSSAPDFYRQHKVMDGASDLLMRVFGESGRHARCALGASVLPFNLPVEADLVIAVR